MDLSDFRCCGNLRVRFISKEFALVCPDFLNDGQLSPMFFTKPANPQTATGTLDIYYFFLGNEVTRDGSGTVAQINFTTKQTTASQTDGVSLIELTSESEFVDPDDIPILINYLGSGTVEVQ